jgi:hypothetical protein
MEVEEVVEEETAAAVEATMKVDVVVYVGA